MGNFVFKVAFFYGIAGYIPLIIENAVLLATGPPVSHMA
jgi:hypothetical protein